MKEICRFMSMIHQIRLLDPSDTLAPNSSQDAFYTVSPVFASIGLRQAVQLLCTVAVEDQVVY